MSQIILETVKSVVLDKLKHLAQKHDRTLEAEITAILEDITESMTIPQNQGWAAGFFEQTCGCWEGEPLVREPQPEAQERESLW
jgi:plasmid stability protein